METVIILWQFCLISRDIKVVYKQGLAEYITDLWNVADWFTNLCFISWIILRFTSCYLVSQEMEAGQDPYIPREVTPPAPSKTTARTDHNSDLVNNMIKSKL